MLVHLYAGPDGVSHFKDLAPAAGAAAAQAAKDVTFTKVPAGTDRGWITPGYRHYVFFMAGPTEIGCGDGVKKVFNPGDVLLIDDLTGKHTSRVLPGTDRMSMHVQMA